MAKINFKNLSFNPSPGSTGARLRLLAAGVAAAFAAGTVTAEEIYAKPFAEVGNDGVIDSAEIAGVGGANAEGTFDLCLTATDDAGNESDFAFKAGVPLDLVAPAAPTWN